MRSQCVRAHRYCTSIERCYARTVFFLCKGCSSADHAMSHTAISKASMFLPIMGFYYGMLQEGTCRVSQDDALGRQTASIFPVASGGVLTRPASGAWNLVRQVPLRQVPLMINLYSMSKSIQFAPPEPHSMVWYGMVCTSVFNINIVCTALHDSARFVK